MGCDVLYYYPLFIYDVYTDELGSCDMWCDIDVICDTDVMFIGCDVILR